MQNPRARVQKLRVCNGFFPDNYGLIVGFIDKFRVFMSVKLYRELGFCRGVAFKGVGGFIDQV